MDEEFYTVQEAARELGVSDGAIRVAIAENRINVVRKYGRNLISREQLDLYKGRSRPDGVKPKGRPKKMLTT